MQNSLEELKQELKKLIIEESGKDLLIENIEDNAPLFGEDSEVMLDSLDVLQISVAIHKKYGKKLNDSKDAMRVFTNINSLANYINSR